MTIVRSGYATTRRNGSTRAWRKARLDILANATRCAICGQPEHPHDRFEVDHIQAHADNGSMESSNLRAAHRSCNRQRGRAA